MKRCILTLLVFTLAAMGTRVMAQDYRLAAGIRLSNSSPTLNNAVSVKYFVTDRNALEGIVSFGSRFGLGGLIELHRPLGNSAGFNWFYGGGAYVGFGSGNTYVGPTGIIGIDYKFNGIPLNLSLDWKPELDIVPSINFVPDAFALSARFVFK